MLILKFLHAFIDRNVAVKKLAENVIDIQVYSKHIRYSLPFHYQYYLLEKAEIFISLHTYTYMFRGKQHSFI